MEIRLLIGSIVLLVALLEKADSQAGLQPGQFNLATGRRVTATATCGEGVTYPEMYCKLIGANLERGDQQQRVGHEKYFIVQGQICDYCDPSSPDQSHSAENAIDGTERWWQSPPLSRGSQNMEVNLTIDFSQEFHVAYVFVTMGNSPRPEVWVLERSTDYGQTWQPWQYFADPPSDCEAYFGVEPDQPILKDDDVICTSKYSKIVPLEGGEIVVSLVNDRPGSSNFLSSMVLQNWTKATNVRFSFRRMKTLMGHTSAVARQDQTVTRRYYYSIRDISIGGLCVCNGHANSCDLVDPNEPYRQLCRCVHNTCGPYCDRCCPGFVQKKWKAALENSSHACEPCNCHGHSGECDYDPETDEKHLSVDTHGNYEGGGVCRNCQHNTEGINCDKCRSGYYRPYGKSKSDRDACQVCRCNPRFSTGNCAEGTGICECKPNFTGTNCDRCNLGYYDYPDCKACECNFNGTLNQVCNVGVGACPCKSSFSGPKCDQCAENFFEFPNCTACDCDGKGTVRNTACNRASGQCVCENNFGGRRCDQCGDGYFNHPSCNPCDCDPAGTVKEICDKNSGVCICKPGYRGARCDVSAEGFYNYPDIRKCDCDAAGSLNDICDASTGRCPCKNNFSGRACDMCATGYYKFPECLACNCDNYGTIGTTCDNRGQCQCKKNFVGKTCNLCMEGFYNYPLCEGCNCNPAGLIASFGGCGKVQGELCQCKERVSGRICDHCKTGYWGLDIYNPLGCDDCACNVGGTVSAMSVCNERSGACPCKTNVEARQCTKCKDGFYKLEERNLHGCITCGCDAGGAVNNICDKSSGQCSCRPRINGKMCSQVLKLHYFPTLHHLKFEAEDGRAKENGPVQYEYAEADFPNYSWRGYAVMSPKQQEIQIPIQIRKPSLYRMIIRYVNLANTTAKADIVLSPEANGEQDQKATVDFIPTKEGRYAGVGEGTNVNTFVLHPGQWQVALKSAKPVLVDYIVLLPQAYYEATLLQQNAHPPCLYGQTQTACRNYTYPDTENFIRIDPKINSFFRKNGDQLNPQIDDTTRPGVKGVLIDQSQPELTMEPEILPAEPHHLILSYFTRASNSAGNLNVSVAMRNDVSPTEYKAALYNCPYGHLCRSVVLDSTGKVAAFAPTDRYAKITLSPIPVNGDQLDFVLADLIAVPQAQWHEDYVRPQSGCVLVDGKCQVSEFPQIADANLVEAETDLQITQMRPEVAGLPAGVATSMLYLANQTTYLRGTTQRPGDHVIIVHYYQPVGPGGQLEAAVQGAESTPAVLDTSFCPSASGCRAILRHSEGSHRYFRLGKEFSVTIKGNDGHELYLDYVIAVPSDKFEERFLHESSRNLASDFINQCGNQYFDIDPSTQGFCRQGTFSLAAGFNNEAAQCECNLDGSTSFQCEEMGGQCPCKANVIGRKCNRCKSGYWGFPNCKLCNCPFNSVCDPVSGTCICPPKVQGERCDTCMPRTYGFHPITGCQECNCNGYGTNGSLECEQDTGKCFCKQNVGGRICDRCNTGYYSFPQCQACHYCDIQGATDGICDQLHGQCSCKVNVAGPRCDMCKPSTFLLDGKNPLGCTKCFCFGITNRCQSSVYFRTLIPQTNEADLSKWTTIPPFPVTLTGTGAEAAVGQLATPNQEVFWVAPPSFLGNRVTSYGGKLAYSLSVTAKDTAGSMSPDVILKGRNMTVVYMHDTQPISGSNHEVEVEMVERNFEHDTGNKVTREQFMTILVALEAIHIKAGYFPNPTALTLNYATIEGAVPPNNVQNNVVGTDIAIKVEECNCPPEYSGSSCENCAAQHFRSKTGPFLGICLPCDCNNHAERCDPETGQCINCLHNTTGERCEKCADGYHGDASRGSPYDCMICACPIPIESNNFATTCDVAPDGLAIYCTCREGYVGERCQYCAPGYFGRPEVPGGYCQPCKCHGHIDALDPESCHPSTGDCLKCLNNTSGPHCATCRTDFFGDPTMGSCQVCDCEPYGTEDCNTTDGTCKCWPNVEGLRCDHCVANYWNFESGRGCAQCQCGIGSRTQQCAAETGQCVCQPGVSGKRCEICEHGYWNYTAAGCTRCACATKYSVGEMCDQQTGHCSCLPGVTGSDCDRCKLRHVLVENVGCRECGYCVHTLLDDFDELHGRIDVADREFERVSASQFAVIRLNRVNQTISNLTQAINFLTSSGAPMQLQTFSNKLDGFEKGTDSFDTKLHTARKSAEEKLAAADKAREELAEMLRNIHNAKKNATELTASIAVLENYLRQGPGSKVTESTLIAEPILTALRSRKFDDYKSNATFEFNQAKTAKDQAGRVQGLNNGTTNRTQTVEKSIREYQEKMRDLEKLAVNASETVALARVKTESVKENITDNINALVALEELIRHTLGNSTSQGEEAQLFLTAATSTFGDVDSQKTGLKTSMDQLEASNRVSQTEQREVQPVIQESRLNVGALEDEANRLDRMFSPTRNAAAAGKSAASAYDGIVKNIRDAEAGGKNASQVAKEAGDTSTNIRGNVDDSLKASEGLLQKADESKIDALKLRGTLERTQTGGLKVRDENSRTEQVIGAVKTGMIQLPREDVKTQANDLNVRATAAHDKAAEALRKAEEITEKLTGAGVPQPITQRPDGSSGAPVVVQEIIIAENAARQVPNEIPQFNAKITTVETLVASNEMAAKDLGNKLAELRRKIDLTRNKADQIKVGMQLFRNNSVQLKNPADISAAATYTYISLYFKTPEKDGLLFYLGNEVGTSKRVKRDFSPITDDYMALEIQNGFVVLLFDLGSGHARIEVRDRYVSDNRWHQAIVERTGKIASVRVRSEKDADGVIREAVAEGAVPGSNTVFNLNQENSTLFVGGMPLSFRVQTPVRNKRFGGYIDDLEFDHQPIGLWNHGNYSNDPSAPYVAQMAIKRDKERLPDKGQAEDGIKFDGSGYAIFNMESRTDVSRTTAINLEIKTFAKEGLLFFLSEEGSADEFFSLELKDGHVLLQFNLGSGVASIRSPERCDDGKWHTVMADRVGKTAVLSIDAEKVGNGTSPGHEDKLEFTRYLYVGGHPLGHTSVVTSQGFEGCLRNLEFDNRQMKLESSKEAKGMVLGCSETIRRTVSFAENNAGYLAMPSVNVEQSLHFTLKFKTVQPNGLLFLTSNEDNSQILSLAMIDGKVVLATDNGRGQVTSVSTDLSGYWNGEWHYVSASKDASKLRLMIDDFETVSADQGLTESLQTSKPLYFGGVPVDFSSRSNAVPSTRSFVGCIGDVVVNDVFQNFAISQDRPGASFASCIITLVPGQILPTLPPQPTPATLPPFWQPVVLIPTDMSGQSTLPLMAVTELPTSRSSRDSPITLPATTTIEATAATAATPATAATEATPAEVFMAVTEVTTAYPGPVLDSCTLPLKPDMETTTSTALQFGSRPDSRQEFSASPSQFMDKSEFSVEFKTNATEGIILYVDDQKASPIDFLAIYMKNGQLVYAFNPGSGPAVVRSPSQYNNGQWHTVKAVKRNRVGLLLVDGVEVQTGESPGTTEILNTKMPVYLGGINGKRNTAKNLDSVLKPFDGCLRNLRLNGAPFGDASATVAVEPCSAKTEPGAFFFAEGGHISLREKFVVGQDLVISIEVRPRSNNGVILAVGTSRKRRDFLALQLIDGVVDFSFDNGGGVTRVNVTLPSSFFICDGGWHIIRAAKSRFVASLTVDNDNDNGYSGLVRGPSGQSAADTDLPLYLGSLPASMPNLKTVVRKQYVGCMRNLQLNDQPESFANGNVTGNVLANSCHIA